MYRQSADQKQPETVRLGVVLIKPTAVKVPPCDGTWHGKLARAVAAHFAVKARHKNASTDAKMSRVLFVGNTQRAYEARECFKLCFEHAYAEAAHCERSKGLKGDVTMRSFLTGYAIGIKKQHVLEDKQVPSASFHALLSRQYQ